MSALQFFRRQRGELLLAAAVLCAATPTAGGNYGLGATSPCLPEASPCEVRIGALGQACGVTSVPPDSPDREGSGLLSLSPSPFLDEVAIHYSFSGPGPVQLVVYDLSGRVVWSFRLDSPVGSFIWGGEEGRGRPALPGMYFIRVAGGGESRVKRIAKVR